MTPAGGHAGRVWGLCAACVGSILFGAASARADLADDVRALAEHWKPLSSVTIHAPRVLSHSQLVPLLLPAAVTGQSSDRCTTVAVLGAMSTSFVVRFLPPGKTSSPRRGEDPEHSVGGAVELLRCGPRRESLKRLAVEMRSPRGVIQSVAAKSETRVPPLRSVLQHREPGAMATVAIPEPSPVTEPARERAERLGLLYEQRAASAISREMMPAGPDGRARALVELEPGCHRFDLLGIVPISPPSSSLDIDAELRWADTGQLGDIDRTDSPDAALQVCVGQTRLAVLAFAGGLEGIPVLVLRARWPLPPFLPARWGPRAQANAATMFFDERARPSEDAPVYESLGVAGITYLPVELEPDACYVGLVTLLRGEPKLLSLAVQAGGPRVFAHSQNSETSALIAFCANAASRARLEVEAHGPSLTWLVALWRSGRLPLGVGAE